MLKQFSLLCIYCTCACEATGLYVEPVDLATLPPCPFYIFRLARLISSWWHRQMPEQLVVRSLETRKAQRHRSRTLHNHFMNWETFAYLLILFAACESSIYSNYSNNGSGENDCRTGLERSCGFLHCHHACQFILEMI